MLSISKMNRRRRQTVAGALRVAGVGVALLTFGSPALADQLRLVDGRSIEVEEAWEDARGVWFRRQGVTEFIARDRVRRIERRAPVVETIPAKVTAQPRATVSGAPPAAPAVRIYLVGGARMEVDEVTESIDGVWHRRGNVSMHLERARIERIERGPLTEHDATSSSAWKEHGWTTGQARLDTQIRQNGARFGVDPYLIFCVMEQESHFNARALSPKGARGLMQLMPGTAARFGVRNAHDPEQNIMGGTRYLKELHRRFGGRVELVLAGYNAGEGAVMKYGQRVPPYRETRDYVQRISARYERGARRPASSRTGATLATQVP